MIFVKNIFFLILGFVLLIKGADFFVDGASGVAKKFGIPEIIIGLTIVAFGTSAPEAAISINSALQGSAEISLGNVLGSNVLNVLLILGLTACIKPLTVKLNTVKYEIPFAFFATLVLVAMGAVFGKLTIASGIILWILMIVFFVYLVISGKKNSNAQDEEEAPTIKTTNPFLLIAFIVGGLLAIVIGSDLTVDSATVLAKELGASDRLIALTIIAFGTSLPELVTSITAARKNSVDIAIGNIIGSNIFNILFVIGTASIITNINYSSDFFVDGIMCLVSLVVLELFVLRKKKLSRLGGAIMLLMYAAYFVVLLVL